MTETDNEIKIIAAEAGPRRADRLQTYHVGKCSGCDTEIYFFKMEKYTNCFSCGAWTKKPVNGEARTI